MQWLQHAALYTAKLQMNYGVSTLNNIKQFRFIISGGIVFPLEVSIFNDVVGGYYAGITRNAGSKIFS